MWPEDPRPGQPTELAIAFANEALGWDSPSASAETGADPSGPVWVRLGQQGVDELVDVLTVPASQGGRILVQIGVPWATGTSVGAIELGQPGSKIGLIRIRGTEMAEVTIRLGDGSQIVLRADRTDIANGRLEVPSIGDPTEIKTVLIRYIDSENQVIAATGANF